MVGPRMANEDFEVAASSQSQAEMLESLEQQLVALYQEKQEASQNTATLAIMQETIDNLEAQLVSLYHERNEMAYAA